MVIDINKKSAGVDSPAAAGVSLAVTDWMVSSRLVVALEVSSAAVETLAAANWMAYNRQAEGVEASVADVMMVAVEKIYSKASVGNRMGIEVSSSAAVSLVIMLDVANE